VHESDIYAIYWLRVVHVSGNYTIISTMMQSIFTTMKQTCNAMAGNCVQDIFNMGVNRNMQP
jgi:hypothetical protein